LTICIAALSFNSCIKHQSPVYRYFDEPAIVLHIGADTALRTVWGIFYVSGLSDTIKAGDCLWTNFVIDFDAQASSYEPQVMGKFYMAAISELTYTKIGMRPVRIISGDMSDDYNDLIAYSELYSHYIDQILFFGFDQKGGAGEYDYELICNTDSIAGNSSTPRLFLKSKKTGNSGKTRQHYGFDMSEFVERYFDESSNSVSLYLNYKSGTSPQGYDIYTSFNKSPVVWRQ
jgi:hypothetical protein